MSLNKQNLIETLKIDEGVVYEVYLDHLGYATFGVGHLVTKRDPEYNQPVGTKVSEERVNSAFEDDLNIMIRECEILFKSSWHQFPDFVQEIMVNMMFNLGRTRLTKFKKMRAALHCFDWTRAAQEGRDSLWYRQVTNRAERLMLRLEGKAPIVVVEEKEEKEEVPTTKQHKKRKHK
jgi:GH24 family phage-related lysozyme (muramidase)